jgi:hypothetical protein
MKKLLLVLPLLLTGCSQTAVQLLAPEYKIVTAPEELYACPVEKVFPKSDTLTNKQVGTLVLKLQKNNITCRQSLDAIHKFYDDAEKTVSEKKS